MGPQGIDSMTTILPVGPNIDYTKLLTAVRILKKTPWMIRMKQPFINRKNTKDDPYEALHFVSSIASADVRKHLFNALNSPYDIM